MAGKTHPRSGEASGSDAPDTPPPERVEEGQTAAEQAPQNRGNPASWQCLPLQTGLSPVQELRRIREALEAAGGARGGGDGRLDK